MRLRHALPTLLLTLATTTAFADVKLFKDPCVLVTAQDASTILGFPVKPFMAMEGICTYVNAAGSVVLQIRASIFENPADSAEILDAMSRIHPANMPTEAVPGLGDRANFLPAANGDLTLLTVKQRNFLTLLLRKGAVPDPAAVKAKLIQAARQGLNRF